MIRIITDSLCDLTMAQAQADALHIDVLPLTVRFGETDYLCGIELTNEAFYEKLETCDDAPSSAAVNPYTFEEIFKKYLDAGDNVIAILFSKHMSATYQSAAIAAQSLASEKLWLIDCESGAMGQALLVKTAVSLRDKGLSAQEIAQKVTALLPRAKTYFIVDNMEYLNRGGRISKSAEPVGSQIKVHPVLQLLPDGVKPVDKVKGRKSCNTWLINRLLEQPADTDYLLVFILEDRF